MSRKEGSLMRILTLLTVLALGGCSTFSSEHFQSEGAKASGFCIKGGYMMAGGMITGAKINEEFKGQVTVRDDCSIVIVGE